MNSSLRIIVSDALLDPIIMGGENPERSRPTANKGVASIQLDIAISMAVSLFSLTGKRIHILKTIQTADASVKSGLPSE
jgi:hypothetical protein